jgi:hypothetical protein
MPSPGTWEKGDRGERWMRGGGVCTARTIKVHINITFYKNVFTKHKKCDIINLRNDLFRSHFEYRKLQAYIFIIDKNVCSVSVRLCRYSVIVIERLFRSIRATFFVRGFGCALFILEGKNEQLQVSGI